MRPRAHQDRGERAPRGQVALQVWIVASELLDEPFAQADVLPVPGIDVEEDGNPLITCGIVQQVTMRWWASTVFPAPGSPWMTMRPEGTDW